MTDYAKLFDRIPDDIVLSVSAQKLNMNNRETCICGWVLREQIGRATSRDPERVHHDEWFRKDRSTPAACAARFGGEYDDWEALFTQVIYSRPLAAIETAWVDRLDRAVQNA